MRKNIIFLSIIAFIFSFNLCLFAQSVEQVEKTQQEIEKERLLRQKIEKEKEKPRIEQPAAPAVGAPPTVEGKVLITNITVTGVTLISEQEINEIILPYKNKELTVREMQKVADLITDAYRQKGYVTSRAFLPPQKIVGGVLEIRAVEGVTGDIEVKGNRYYKAALYRNKIILKKGEPFDYDNLRKGLAKINQLPDRNAKAVLAPGKAPGSTDVVLEVKDRFPTHIGFDWDNYGSRYIGKDRYRTTLTHNNLTGLDDTLVLQYQLAEADQYSLLSLRYLLPVNENLDVGFFAARTKLDMGRELKDLDTRGKSSLYSIFATQSLIDRENLAVDLDFGFDYKDVFNFQYGNETSRDRLRVLKTSLDFDLTDKLGRTIVTDELAYGIPDLMGGLDDTDAHASRTGAGGKFTKDTLNFLRLQKMPLDSTVLLKTQMQFASRILTAAEQFQIGGIVNVRAYPPAELVGDNGYSATLEWSVPPHFISKNLMVPFSKAKFYDALRLVTFYDWANVHLRSTQPGEEKNRTLRGIGCGLRLNLPEDFSMRVEFAWPLDNTPTDGDHLHVLSEVSKRF